MRKLFNGLSGAFAAAAATLALTASPPAFAQQASDTFNVFDASGALFLSVSITDALEAGTTVVIPIPFDPAQVGNATGLVEPGTNVLSDVFGVCTACGPGGTAALVFLSDTDAMPVTFPGPLQFTFPETGPVSATLYLDPLLRNQGFTAVFTSDADIPEPATWALMLIGFGGLGAVMRGSRRRQAPIAA